MCLFVCVLVCSLLVRSAACLFGCLLVCSFGSLLVGWSRLVRVLLCSFVRLLVSLFLSTLLFDRSYAYLCDRLPAYLFVPSFACLLACSFVSLFRNVRIEVECGMRRCSTYSCPNEQGRQRRIILQT